MISLAAVARFWQQPLSELMALPLRDYNALAEEAAKHLG